MTKMHENEVVIHKDFLFVALTRVPTILGVPYMAFVLEMMYLSLTIIMMGNLMYAATVIPVHGLLYLLGANDPGIFGELEIWLKTTGRCLNARFWGAASFSPLSIKKWQF